MKPVWLIPAFLAGGVAGALLLRSVPASPPEGFVSADEARVPAPPSPAAPAKNPGDALSSRTAARGASSAPAVPTATAPVAPAVTTPGGKPIDLGPTLREALANQPAVKIESPAELHAAIENEARDDSWSYPLEAEIRNSLADMVQNHAVTLHTVECRSTLCEVRLSTYDYNFRLLHDWNQGVGAYPWIRQVTPVTMMMPRANDRLEMLLILRRATAQSSN